MLEPEAITLVGRMEKLWSRWKPTDEELQQWVQLLKRASSFQEASHAIQRLWEESRFLSPSPKEFRDLLSAEDKGDRGLDPNEGYGASGVWIQCVEAPADFPSRLGWHMEMMYCMDNRLPDDPTVILRHAENARVRHERVYGGRWVVVQQATQEDLTQRKSAICFEAGRTE